MLKRNWPRLLSILALIALALAVATPHAAAGNGNEFVIPEKAPQKYPVLGSPLDRLVAGVEAGETTPRQTAA